jgi:hypothetical protein
MITRAHRVQMILLVSLLLAPLLTACKPDQEPTAPPPRRWRHPPVKHRSPPSLRRSRPQSAHRRQRRALTVRLPHPCP